MKQKQSVVLRDGHEVSKRFYVDICNQVLKIIPYLVPGTPYTVAELCGWKFWAKLNEHQRGLAERCLEDLVQRGLLPLERVDDAPSGVCEAQYSVTLREGTLDALLGDTVADRIARLEGDYYG